MRFKRALLSCLKCPSTQLKALKVASLGFVLLACEGAPPPPLVPPPLEDLIGGQEEANQRSPVSPMLRSPSLALCPPSAPTPIAPQVIRRLTKIEYGRTLVDLTGLSKGEISNFLEQIPPDEEVLGFDNQSSSLQVSATHVESYMKVAEQVAWTVADHIEEHAGCQPIDSFDEACLSNFIERFGLRAWRRPLTAHEKAELLELYLNAVAGAQADLNEPGAEILGTLDPTRDGITSIVIALLQSPYFLYRVEFGRSLSEQEQAQVLPLKNKGHVFALTSYELASRLSYLLWRSMPDEALFESAAQDLLQSEEGLIAEVERMMNDPKAADGLWSFFEQWFALDEVPVLDKDPALFPNFDTSISKLLATEARMFVEEIVFRQRDMRALHDASYSFMNRKLLEFYAHGGEGVLKENSVEASLEWSEVHRTGEIALPSTEEFERVELNPERRQGLMTRGAVLALTTKANAGDPVHRGLFIRERLLCTPLPPPPPDIVVVAPDPDPNLTTRQQFAVHSEEASCAGCHRLMDPLAWAFEKFDASGRWRETENGQEIDESGEIVATLDIDGPYEGPIDMAERLSRSEQVQRCVVLNMVRYTQGRAEVEDDVCEVNDLYQEYERGGYDFLSLLKAIVRSPTFRYLHLDEVPEGE